MPEISLSVFKNFLNCKYKAHLKNSGTAGNISNYETMWIEKEQVYRSSAITKLSGALHVNPSNDLSTGAPVLIDIRLSNDGLISPTSVLIRQGGRSTLGAYHYASAQFVNSSQINPGDKLSLAFDGFLLGSIQGRTPKYGTIFFGQEFKAMRILLRKHMTKVAKTLSEMRSMLANESPPQMILNAHCKACEFQTSCRASAIEKDHLSLLSGMTEKEMQRVGKRGIFSVTQYSYLFRARKNAATPRSHSFPLKALAIRDKKVFVYGMPSIETKTVQIFFDVEGDASQGFDYLVGVLVVTGNSVQSFSFWADTPDQERNICRQLLDLLARYADFQLFHYGSYETRFLQKIKTKYSQDRAGQVDHVIKSAVNILTLIYSHIYFPTYTNGLKEIGAFLGFRWTDPKASGLQSLVWRYEWERNPDPGIKQKLIQYNADDCTALRMVTETILKIQAGQANGYKIENAAHFRPHPRTYGNTDYVLPEFDLINKCAYFDYQRDKVHIREKGNSRTRRLPNRRRMDRSYRINRVVRFTPPRRCRRCQGKTLYKHHRYVRKSIDLKFTPGGIKRWVTKYHSDDYRCASCKALFRPERNVKIQKYGRGLISWLIYQNVVAGTPFFRTAEILYDMLDLTLSKTTLHHFKHRAAIFYRQTYDRLLRKITHGPVLYADETKVGLAELPGYIWAFTNLKEAVYSYRETRESQFLKDWLSDFKGVLVSDFYPGYESVNCDQQKCLVHLMRDMNDDLLANPYDDEFRGMAQKFATLLRAIVGTIDRFGLRHRYLRRHQWDVKRFMKQILGGEFKSELVDKYRKRFQKNSHCLFTFLDHDGVSWNNNAAEHVIKHFAIYRNAARGPFTASGIRQYLVMLSIYQSCKLQSISFLKFLLSGKKDLDDYVLSGGV